MPWRDDIIRPLEESDPGRNYVRMRLNVERGTLSDFVVQYEMRRSDAEDDYVAVV